MLTKIFDLSIPLAGAIVFWLLYARILPVKKDKDANDRFYRRNKKFLLLGAVVLSVACVLIAIGR